MKLHHKRYVLGQKIQKTKTRLAVGLSALVVAVSGSGMSLAMLNSAQAITPTTVVVHQSDLANSFGDLASNPTAWFMYNDSNDTIDSSLGNFVLGPSTPPHGSGSVEFALGGSTQDRKNIATYQFSGTKLSDITDLSFTSYSHGGSGGAGVNESPFLAFNVTFNGTDSWQKRLVYVPSANMASVPQNTWNTFDTLDGGNGMWTWSGYEGNGNTWPNGNTSRYLSWNEIKTAWPDAAIRTTDSWLGVRVGEPGPSGYVGDVDAITFGTASNVTTYDFEPVVAHGQITAPTAGAYVHGTIHLTATYADNDTPNTDGVQWALRQGTCAANTGTVFGNVDGHSDPFSWDGNNFSATFNTTTVADGGYCFVFNPTDDPGQPNVRETQNFTIDNTKPDAAFVSPTDFSNPFNVGPNVTVAASDATSGLGVLVIHVYNAGTNAAAKFCTATPTELAAGQMSCDLSTLSDGTYYIKAGANDKAGNNRTINSGNFVIDSVKPNVDITSPANGALLYTGTFNVNGMASDAATGVDHVLYTVTKITGIGGTYLSDVASGTATGTAAWNFDTSSLPDGYYRLKVQAFDGAGNWRYEYHDVQVMTSPTDKSQCKDGGWRNFTEHNFRNQGQCVEYVEHHSNQHHEEHHNAPHHWWNFWHGWHFGWVHFED